MTPAICAALLLATAPAKQGDAERAIEQLATQKFHFTSAHVEQVKGGFKLVVTRSGPIEDYVEAGRSPNMNSVRDRYVSSAAGQAVLLFAEAERLGVVEVMLNLRLEFDQGGKKRTAVVYRAKMNKDQLAASPKGENPYANVAEVAKHWKIEGDEFWKLRWERK